MPPFDLFRHIIVESITLTMVTYTVTMSMGLTFAVREKYDIDANQELFAMVIFLKIALVLPQNST